MKPAEEHEKEFVIPTKYKTQVSSRLSWPLGAMEITKNLAGVPQLEKLQLSFATHHKFNQQGEWPAMSVVFELRYSPQPFGEDVSNWQISVYPVPKNMRAKVREAFASYGFKSIVDWLNKNANFSSRASDLGFLGFWHSEGDKLSFSTHNYIVPEISKTRS